MKNLNIIIAEWARRGAKISKSKHGKMCGGCAFKVGTEANNEPHNVEAAAQCLVGMGKFNCHKHGPDGELKDGEKPCVGFLYAEEFSNQTK